MDDLFFLGIGAALALGCLALIRRWLGFAGQRPADYENDGPQFDLRRDLNGRIRCDGVIYGPFGRVTSRFHGQFEASWTGNTGIMREHFTYDSGTQQHRAWELSLGNDGSIQALAEDVVGTGRGTQRGSAVNLRYRLRLPDDAGGHVLDVDDWMYLAPGGAVVNRSQFRKFGIKVAELVATMHREDADQREAA